MALGDNYATLTQLKGRVGIAVSDTAEDGDLNLALSTASTSIEDVCERQFNVVAVAAARVFEPLTTCTLLVDDISSTSGLIVAVDTGADGTYATTWASTDYELHPLNGVVRGRTGWPYTEIRAVGDYAWPSTWRRAPVRVTALWGWAAVPDPIETATLILAEELYKLKDSPFGSGGYGQFGIIRARQNPMVFTRIQPYLRSPLKVA